MTDYSGSYLLSFEIGESVRVENKQSSLPAFYFPSLLYQEPLLVHKTASILLQGEGRGVEGGKGGTMT